VDTGWLFKAGEAIDSIIVPNGRKVSVSGGYPVTEIFRHKGKIGQQMVFLSLQNAYFMGVAKVLPNFPTSFVLSR